MQSFESCKGKTILVADDDEGVRGLICGWLEDEGHNTVTAETGEGALEALMRQNVDLALLDVVMPRGSGYSVCRQIKKGPETRLIPVVLITGLDGREDRILGIDCGADDFLNKPVHKEELLARVRSSLRLKQFTDELENAEAVLFSLALSIEAKDPYTEGHCQRLSEFSVALAERVGLPEEQRLALRRAGIVHDIGKIMVPDQVLLKPGPLTPEERNIMQTHPAAGERICRPLRSFRSVLPIIRHHHEKLDGSGYPDGLKNEQIPIVARVLQTVDVYDALATDRPYRKALPSRQALACMREEVERGWWDGMLIDEMEKLLPSLAERSAWPAVPNSRFPDSPQGSDANPRGRRPSGRVGTPAHNHAGHTGD